MSLNQRSADQWHLDKKVPLSLIFAMLIQAAMVLWAVADIKKDVELLKAQVSAQRDRDDRQDRSLHDSVIVLRVQLEKIDTKLDRLIEKGQK